MEEQVQRPERQEPARERRHVLPPRPVRAPAPQQPELSPPAARSLDHSLFPAEEGAPLTLDQELVARVPALADLYAELAVLGSGGTSVVHLARDRKTGEQVALKRLRRADDGQRFLREARTIATLDHPGIVRLLRVVTTDSDEVALALEHVAGPDLESLVQQRGAMSCAEALLLARHLAHALAYAHERGVIHRDVKPGNVLLPPGGRPKLTDFGLALAAPDHSLLESTSRGWCGTLDYMAPEQRQDADRVDGRADVFGLGATLYRLLTGSSPRVIREGRIPEPARELVLRCVEESPGERWASMEVLITALVRAETRARADESDARTPLERIADAFQRRLEQAERGETGRRLEVAAGGLQALGLLAPGTPQRLRARLDLGEPCEPELARLVAEVLESVEARGRGAASLLADAHALLVAAIAGVPLSERGKQALRLLDRKSRRAPRPALADRLVGVLRRLIELELLDGAALPLLSAGEPEPRALLERLLQQLRAAGQAAGAAAWPEVESRWRRALDELAGSLLEAEPAERVRRERMVLELERLQRETAAATPAPEAPLRPPEEPHAARSA